MKKILFLFSVLLFISCSGGDDESCDYSSLITTSDATNVSLYSATLHGYINLDSPNCNLPNSIEQGFVYSVSIQPTINDFKINVNGSELSAPIENLEPNTTYFVRAFIRNSAGEFYANEVSFKTYGGPINQGCSDYLVKKATISACDGTDDNVIESKRIYEVFYNESVITSIHGYDCEDCIDYLACNDCDTDTCDLNIANYEVDGEIEFYGEQFPLPLECNKFPLFNDYILYDENGYLIMHGEESFMKYFYWSQKNLTKIEIFMDGKLYEEINLTYSSIKNTPNIFPVFGGIDSGITDWHPFGYLNMYGPNSTNLPSKVEIFNYNSTSSGTYKTFVSETSINDYNLDSLNRVSSVFYTQISNSTSPPFITTTNEYSFNFEYQ